MKKLVIALTVLAVAVVGGSWFYVKVVEGDPAPKLTLESTSGSPTTRASSDDGTLEFTLVFTR